MEVSRRSMKIMVSGVDSENRRLVLHCCEHKVPHVPAFSSLSRVRELHDKTTWEQKLQMLQRYKETHNGNTNVRDGYRDPDSGFNLGQWVSNMRRLKIAGKLDAAKERDLITMDFVWGRSLQQRWDDMYQILL